MCIKICPAEGRKAFAGHIFIWKRSFAGKISVNLPLKSTENPNAENGFLEKNMKERFHAFTKVSDIPAKWLIKPEDSARRYGISAKKLTILHKMSGIDKRKKIDKM